MKTSNIEELTKWKSEFNIRKISLRADARQKIVELVSSLPNMEIVSENTLGYFSYENQGCEWAEAAIHGIRIEKYNDIIDIVVTSECDYDENDNPCVYDWLDHEMTFYEDDVVLDYPETVLSLISEIESKSNK